MINKKDFMLCGKITKEDLKKMNLNASWKANIKYDGERIIAIKKDGEIFLFNRRGRLKNSFYLEVVEGLNAFDGDFIVDGEVITYDDNFNKLQKRALTTNAFKQEQLRKEVPVIYMLFDILNFNGKDIRQFPLIERIIYLHSIFNDKSLENNKSIGYAQYEDINKCLSYAEEINHINPDKIEGIIIKNMYSPYQNKRSNDWLKLKFFKNTDLKLISYTSNNAGIRCEDKELNAIQISGHQHHEVKNKIDEKGFCDVTIQYLQQGKTGRYRFPSFVGVKND
ncbi:MAG: ATP-dependent DNA ligase [Nanoarchaeota archaeon]|nr:ATP-dependent DNA ligase [Nanoarchaeota archaeon]